MTRWPQVQFRRVVVSACDGPFGSAIRTDHYAPQGARVIRLGDIGRGAWRGNDPAFLDLAYWRELSSHHVAEGDLVMAGLGDERNPVGRTSVVPALGPALVKADCYRFRLDLTKVIPRFLDHYLSSAAGLAASRAMSDGSTRKRLTLGKALALQVPIPTLGEQRAITNFLDAKTARIDALITKKRRMVELLEGDRMSVMHAGVSGRFTSEAFRSSSLAWLEEVGAGWTEVKLTRVAALGSGHTPSRNHPEWWTNCTVPWVTTGEVAQMRSDRIEVIENTREMISEVGVANSSATIHPAGTVVLCRTAASAGYSAIMGSDMATSQDLATWTCGPRVRPRFLLICLRAMRQDLLGRLAMGSTHRTIYMPDIESIRVPLPEIDEQDRIIDRVWTHLDRLDRTADAIDHQIDLLVEKRQALITAAVTGELEIPGVAA